MAYEPTHEDFNLWAAGHHPTNTPTHTFQQLNSWGTTDLVFQPFAENVVSYGAKGVELFSDVKNHPDAVGAILAFTHSMTKFDPTTGLGNQTDSFDQFLQKVTTFPGFDLNRRDQVGPFQTSENIDKMLEDIKSAYGGIKGVDLTKVVNSVNQMANSVVNGGSKNVDTTRFVQMTITGNGGDLLVTLFYADLKMGLDRTQPTKAYPSSQIYTINTVVLQTRHSNLTDCADRLYKIMGDGSFDEWVSTTSSPGGDKKSCFETHAAAKEQ